MSLYSDYGLDRTIHVSASGDVTYGGAVPHKGANVKNPNFRIVAATHRVVHSRRFAPNRVPAGVDLNVTHPHDCENHLDS